jgi:uncharacterized protein
MARNSALYVGSVAHRRLRPKAHYLRYRMFSLLIDIDELPVLEKELRLFSVGRFNFFGIYRGDYLFGKGESLREEVEAILRDAGVPYDGGYIRLLTMPRILGYGFNPLSIFFCHRSDGRLRAILYEVHNTFGQRHCYLFPVDRSSRAYTHASSKQFYVSPFLPMDMAYAFRIKPPGGAFTISISVADDHGEMLTATQHLTRHPLNDRTLMSVFLTHPFLTLKVIAGIHYEALLIWLKGVGLQERPSPPDRPVTVVSEENREKENVPCQI